jgi:hypothetical protein
MRGPELNGVLPTVQGQTRTVLPRAGIFVHFSLLALKQRHAKTRFFQDHVELAYLVRLNEHLVEPGIEALLLCGFRRVASARDKHAIHGQLRGL